MNVFTIKDVENLSGIKAHTIRIWEQRYDFLKPQRTDTNIRYYSCEDLKTILNISLLNKYGYKISHINKMMPAEIREKILLLNNSEAQLERTINDLIKSMIDIDMDRFEEIIDGYIARKGIERTIVQILFPFLERIGILWQTGRIIPGQEHLVTNIIRQKLVMGIENTRSLVQLDKSFLLYLPEGEHHELGLLFMHYLLKSRGAKVIYMGCNLPLDDMEYIARLKQPDVIYIHLTSPAKNFSFEKYLSLLQLKMPEFNFVVSGLLTHNFKKHIPKNVQFKYSLSEVMEYLSSL